MASSGGGAGSSDNQSKRPKYYKGIPKDLGKKSEPPPQIVPKLDKFSMNLLGHFERNQKAAREKRIAEERARAQAQREEAARREEARKQESEEAAKQIFKRSLGRRSSSSVARSSSSPNRRKSTGGVRKKRRRRNDDGSDSDGPMRSSMKGMEVVRRVKREKTSPRIRNTSDFSELYGDAYLVGADVDVTRELAKTSKAETERVRADAERKKEEKDRIKERSDQFDMMKRRMERSGELKTKAGREKLRKMREKLQAHDYVSVDLARVSTGAGSSKQPLTTKKDRKEAQDKSNAAMKARLKNRLTAMCSEPEFQKFESRKVEPRSEPKGERLVKRRRGMSEDEYSDEEDYRRPKKKARKPVPSYLSESEDEEDYSDDDGGGGFETSFAEVDMEERRSAAIARMEDKREMRLENERKRAKAERRRAAESD